jgi:formate dehydrogenase major subunit
MLVKAVPDKDGPVNKGLLCGRGKFGFDCSELEGKLLEPMIRRNGETQEAGYYESFVYTVKKTQAAAAKYGRSAIAVAVSDRYTNEEAYAVKSLAEIMGARLLSFNNRKSGLAQVLGCDASPNTIDELLSTGVILVVGFEADDNPVIRLKLKQAAEAGAKVILINSGEQDGRLDFAYKTYSCGNDLSLLKEIAKELIESGKVPAATRETEGYEALVRDLSSCSPGTEAKEIAALYSGAKKAMIVFQQNLITTGAAALLADIAVLSGHIGAPRDGILQIKSKNNSQGLIDMGIRNGAEAMDGVKALLVFGEDPDYDFSGLEFLMVCDTHMSRTAEAADVIFPGTGFASAEGTYTNTERRLQYVQSAAPEELTYSNWEVAAEIAHVLEADFKWEDTEDISLEMDDCLPKYRYAAPGEVFGGALVPEDVKLAIVPDGVLVDRLEVTDNLMKMIDARLPKAAKI